MADTTINRVGPLQGVDGSNMANRFTTWSSAVVQQAGGKYAEAVARGNCYSAAIPSGGLAVAAVTVTTTGLLTVHNPLNSGKRLVFLRAICAYVSGTLGAGNIVLAVSPGVTATLISGGTAIVPVNMLAGASGTGSVATVQSAATIAAPIPVRNLANIMTITAAVTDSPHLCTDDIDGEIQCLPGTGLTICGTIVGAGSSPKLHFALMWEEVILLNPTN